MQYCDHNATSPLRPESRAAMERALGVTGNPGSIHAAGRTARAIVEDAREKVADLVHARAEDLIFTASSTEANNLALWGAVHGAIDQNANGSGGRLTRLFVSAVEHKSVLATAVDIAERSAGLRVEHIPVNFDGVVDTEALRVFLREGKGRALVAVMAANNETGVVQPVAEVSRLAREANALLLVDAVPAAGKIELDAGLCDYLTLSAHKIGGPQGVGALVLREGAPFAPLILGGGQQRGRRAGTENLSGSAGFGAAVEAMEKDSGEVARIGDLRDRFETGLKAAFPDAIVFGARSPRLCSTSYFALPGLSAETALIALDLDGVMASSGSTCSSGKLAPSHVLSAMGVADEIAGGAVRISFGWNSVAGDGDAAIAALVKLRTRAHASAA